VEDLNMALSNFSWSSLNSLFIGNEGFIVPKFQREYNWDETYYGQLWDDIETSIKEKRGSYFFGSLFFMGSGDSKELTIIDGQQRIATITILMAVIRDILYGINNSEHQIIDRDFIQHREYLSNQTKPKLQLGERNRKEFFDHIQSLGKPDLKIKQFSVVKKNILDTNKNILNCYEFFFNKIDSNLKAIADKDKENEFLISIIKCVTTVFQTMVISVSDESEAYLVFETLNDRGLELSIADLLKNYLFSKSGSYLKEVQREWDDVIETLNNLDVSTFIRQYWLSTQNQVTEKELFVELKKKLNTKETVLSFVKNLNGESEIYEAILNPNKKYWKSAKIYELLNELDALKARQITPLLMSARNEFKKDSDFEQILNMGINFTFRFITIAHFNNKELESLYSKIAIKIRKKEIRTVEQIKGELKSKYVNDKDFEVLFNRSKIKINQIAKYILKKIEKKLSGGESEPVPEITLEHILPKSPDSEWMDFLKKKGIDKQKEDLVYRIGNMTLLTEKMNKAARNKYFTKKRDEHYKTSGLKLNQDLKSLDEWDDNKINSRQEQLFKEAVKIWKL
jgi:uncharacterized protein with ParB-like and HNH nuclease domain